ncbi:MAG: hypothetical protein N4A70_05495 [Pelagimonas sp.]|jgi:hypothetical protein|nr:hypothetical protein [Pelagimonas sp.]
MAFQIRKQWIIDGDLSLIEFGLPCYDTIGDPAFDLDRDGYLETRSAFEFVSDQLSDEQRAELQLIDQHWQDNAKAFNAAFATMHNQADRESELTGHVEDAGKVPSIPRDHWWWRPIEGAE